IRFDFGTVDEIVLEFDVTLVCKQFQNSREDFFEYVFHSLGTESVNGAEVRTLTGGKPHEADVLPYGLGNLTGGVRGLAVGVDDDFGHESRMITMAVASWIGRFEDLVVDSIDSGVDGANHVILRDIFYQIDWQEQLIHGILSKQRNRS